MDLGKLAQFPVEIEVCRGDNSISVIILEYEEKKELENMNVKEAITYAVSFLGNKKWSDIAFKFFIAKYINKPDCTIATYDRNPKNSEIVSGKNIIDCLKCKMNSAGELTWYCKFILS